MARRSILASRSGDTVVSAASPIVGPSTKRSKYQARHYDCSVSDSRKDAVNEWLGELVKDLGPRSNSWALVLDTPLLRTTRALEAAACGITPATTVVCNPDEDACRSMLEQENHPHVLQLTSHQLLEAPAFPHGDLPGWSGSFGFVWLDFCGTLFSAAGRERQRDVRRLLENNAPLLHVDGAILAVTVSERGLPQLYESELVDSLVLLVEGLGALSGFRTARVAGVARYTVQAVQSSRSRARSASAGSVAGTAMLTVAFFVSACSPLALVAASVPLSLVQPLAAGSAKDGSTGELALTRGGWNLAATRIGHDAAHTRPLWHALCHCAEQFASQAAAVRVNGTLSDGAIVLDTKLLLFSRALANRLGSAVHQMRIVAVVADPLDAALGERLLSAASPLAAPVELISSSLGKVLQLASREDASAAARLPCCRAVWLSYHGSKPFSANRLKGSSAWRDMGDVLRLQLLGRRHGAVLGLLLPISDTLEPWEDAAVDWVVLGVQRAGIRWQYDLRVCFVARFVCTHPWLHLLFRVECGGSNPASDVCDLDARLAPAQWHAHRSWDLDRPKLPYGGVTRSAYVKSVPGLRNALRSGRCTGCVCFSPGFFSAFDCVQQEVGHLGLVHGALPHETTEGENDALARELARRGVPTVHGSHTAPIARAAALVLLDDVGVAAWKRRWMWLLRVWLDSADGRLLVIGCEGASAKAAEDMLKAATPADATCAVDFVVTELRCDSHKGRRLRAVVISFAKSATTTTASSA